MIKRVIYSIYFLLTSIIFPESIVIGVINDDLLQDVNKPLLVEIYKKAAIEVDFIYLPAVRSSIKSSSGEIDGELIRVYEYGKSYSSMIRVPTPFTYLELTSFYINENITVNSWSEIKQYRVGRVRGIKIIENNLKDDSNVVVVNNNIQLFKMLNSGRIDIAVTSSIEGNIWKKELQMNNLKSAILETYPLYHYLHEKNSGIVDILDSVIKTMQESGELKNLMDKSMENILSDY